MNKQTVKQDINNLLQEEIPDNMNILPDIHKQLKQSKAVSRPTFTLSKIAAVIAIFVLMSAGGYALIQRNLVQKGIPQQSITDINQTQTQEGVELTLNWAYADAHRIALAYSMEYERSDDFINAPLVTLRTADGFNIPQDFGGGGGGGGAPGQPTFSETVMNFDGSIIEGEPETVDLVLTIDFSAKAILENPSMAFMMQSGGGGGSASPNAGSGGGGGGDSAPPNDGSGGGGSDGRAPLPTPDVSKILDRIYTFEFTLPFYQPQDAEATQTSVESNGVTMSVNYIHYTPSLIKFELCYNMPDDEIWNAQIQIITDSEDSPFTSRSLTPIDLGSNNDQHCYEVSVSAAIPDDADEFTIDVPYLSQPIRPLTDEAARAEEAYFDKLGYIIEIDADPYGFNFDLVEYPDDVDEHAAQGFVQANIFFMRYEGDWEFIVPLNQ